MLYLVTDRRRAGRIDDRPTRPRQKAAKTKRSVPCVFFELRAPGRAPLKARPRHQLNTFLPFFRDRGTTERISLGFTAIMAANVQQGPQRMVGSLGALDPMRQFARISCPTLVVHAELDPIPVEWSRLLAGTIPGADFAVIEGGSHFSMIEDAAKLRSAVVPWLRSRLARS